MMSFFRRFGVLEDGVARFKQCLELGKFQDALRMADRIKVMAEEQYGENHPYALSAKCNIALVQKRLGQYQEAIDVYQEVYQVYVENLGARHKNSLILLQNIALAHKAKGEFDLVVKYLEQVSGFMQELSSEEQCQVLLNLGTAYRDIGDIGKAVKMQQEALGKMEEQCENDDIRLANFYNAIGLSYMHSGQFDYADENLRKAYEIRHKWNGESHVETIAIRHNIGNLLYAQQKNDEAKEYIAKTLEIMQNSINN